MKLQNMTLSGNDRITLISNLHTMLSAGIPILETIDSLLEDAKGNQRVILNTLRADLVQGQHIYVTFSKFPRVFDKVTVNIIKASEEAGTLDVTLKDITENMRREMEFTDRIKSALIYPVFILGVFLAVMLVILIVVVPKISTVFTQLNVPLPLPTQIMVTLSNLLLHQTLLFVLASAAIVGGIVIMYQKNKRIMIVALTSLPLISRLTEEIDLTHFTRSLYLLLTAGIPITAALEMTEDIVIKKRVKQAIRHVKINVSAGKKLSDGLKDHRRVVPPIMIKIIEAGERSGALDHAMQDVSTFLDYQVSARLKTATALIEPLLLVVVGGLVGGMMMAIIAPIYGLISQVGH